MAELGQSIQKIAPVDLGLEDLGFFNAPAHNVMESTRCIESWLSGHDVPYLNERKLSGYFRTYVPSQNLRPLSDEPTSPLPVPSPRIRPPPNSADLSPGNIFALARCPSHRKQIVGTASVLRIAS